MRVVHVSDDVSREALYPQKRRYFTLFFMGYARDLVAFSSELVKSIPADWPIVTIATNLHRVTPSIIDQSKKMAAISNAAVMWAHSDSDHDFSVNPYLWSGNIGRMASSNKKCFLGSSIPTHYYSVARVSGYDKWYGNLSDLCLDLSVAIKSELVEHVTIESKINVKTGVR